VAAEGTGTVETPTSTAAIRIVGVPQLFPRREPCPLFTMDAEYAEFAATALRKGDTSLKIITNGTNIQIDLNSLSENARSEFTNGVSV
jgi:hypothetical protein